MPATIASSSVTSRPTLSTSIDCSAEAGRDCIAASRLTDADVGLLLNIGIYRDSNIAEPAVAALIQRRIGLNDNPLQARDGEVGAHTFAFDLQNGACGFFNALEVAESFLDTHTTNGALIVASDAHPSSRPHEDFPYAPVGAAMLLTRAQDGSGFRNIMHRASEGEYLGSRSWWDASGAGAREAVTIEIDDGYVERAAAFAADSLREWVRKEHVDARGITYAVASRHPCDLHATVRKVLGLPEERLIDVDAQFGRTFTALPILGYRLAEERGLSKGDRVLFVGVSAGLTFGCGLYEV